MNTLHAAWSCMAISLMFACSDRGSEAPERDALRDEPSAEARLPEQPPSVDGTAAPSPSVRDKLTCPSGCVKVSSAAPSPSCCNCNGQDRTWKRSSWSATTWLCQ